MMLRTLVATALVLGAVACGAPTSADPAATEPTPSETTSPGSPSPAATTAPTDDAATPVLTPAPTGEATADPVAAEGDCSAAGMAGGEVGRVPDGARAMAEFLLDAALRCDEQLLATAASESGTTLTFGDIDPYEFFALPDEGEYATIVTLLTELPHAAEADDSEPGIVVWPRVATDDWADSDEAWQEVVDAGLLGQQEANDMRAAGSGYLGWRIGIRGDGTWMYFVAGD